jgi:hypothetical protein
LSNAALSGGKIGEIAEDGIDLGMHKSSASDDELIDGWEKVDSARPRLVERNELESNGGRGLR